MSEDRERKEGWLLVDPKRPLPCSLGVVARRSRVDELRSVEEGGERRTFAVRAVLSDHIPLAGGMSEILTRPTYHMLAVKGRSLRMFLHHGGDNAVYFDLVGKEPAGRLDYIEVLVESKYPSNCFLAARTAVSHLLDSMMRSCWLPLTIRRLDLHLEGDPQPLCQQLVLPFSRGVRWGPLGGIHQFPFLAPYDCMIREAITTSSPYYRLLCAYRLYEGLPVLRQTLRGLAERFSVKVPIPKPPQLDFEMLARFGFREDFLAGLQNAEDFWKRTTELRNGVVHFLLKKEHRLLSMSDGGTYHSYSLVAAVLLHYSHLAFQDLSRHTNEHFGEKLMRGTILPTREQQREFILRPDQPGSASTNS